MGILDGPYVQEADEDLATGATGLKTEIQSETFYPVFVQLNTSAQNATYWIEVFFHLVNAPLPTNAKISLEPHELKFLTTIVQYENETNQKYPADVRFFIYGNKALLDLIKNGGLLIFDADEIGKIYADFGNDSIGLKVRKDRAQNESSISFLEFGPSVQLPEEGYRIDLNILSDLPLPVRRDAGAIPEKSTLAATIDDGIGFLNERFRKEPDKTRFIEVWAQSRVKPNNDLPRVMIGKDIPRGAINGHLDQIENGETTEQSVYRDLNRELHLNTDTTSLDHSYSHGTHVLDVFAGADPITKSDINLACVQLPPHAVRDTAGKRYEVFALLGVRWIVQKALDLAFDIGNGADMKFVPLVINVSFGTLAGPKDGTGFFEFHLAYEIERYRIITKWLSGSKQELNDGHPYPIRFTLPYGNDYRSRQVYCQQLDLEKSDTLDWRIMPDNFGNSFLELRFERTDGKVFSPPNRILKLELTMPDGTVSSSFRILLGLLT